MYTTDEIFNCAASWAEYMDSSWNRGDDNLKSLYACAKDGTNPCYNSNVDPLSFNFKHKILETAKANARNISLSLAVEEFEDNDEKEERIATNIFQEIMLSPVHKDVFSTALDNVYGFGQSVFHVKSMRYNNAKLNKILTVECIQDAKRAFFDKNSNALDFSDGAYCGRIYQIDVKKLRKKYNKKFLTLAESGTVEVIDFWYKKPFSFTFVKLSTGEYKREDLITPSDAVITDQTVKASIDCICYQRVVKGCELALEKNNYNKGVSYFPLVFDSGGVAPLEDNNRQTFPLGYHLSDTQTFLNYCGSSIAHILKQTEADKYFFLAKHTQTAAAKKTIQELSTRGGAFQIDSDLDFRREQSQQLPPALVEVFGQLQGVIQSLAGSYFDQGSSEIKAASGVALDKLFNRVDLLQNIPIHKHLMAINKVGKVIQNLLPFYYNEERKIGEFVLNQKVIQENGMTVTKNKIGDIANKYNFNVKVSISAEMKDQNLQAELTQLYQIYPQAISQTIDLYVNSLDVQDKDILKRRLSTELLPALIAYGDGNISLADYEAAMAKKMQPQQAMAANEQQTQQKFMEARTLNEHTKAVTSDMNAHTNQFDAQTKRDVATSNATNDHISSIANASKVGLDHENDMNRQRTDLIMKLIEHLLPTTTP